MIKLLQESEWTFLVIIEHLNKLGQLEQFAIIGTVRFVLEFEIIIFQMVGHIIASIAKNFISSEVLISCIITIITQGRQIMMDLGVVKTYQIGRAHV